MLHKVEWMIVDDELGRLRKNRGLF